MAPWFCSVSCRSRNWTSQGYCIPVQRERAQKQRQLNMLRPVVRLVQAPWTQEAGGPPRGGHHYIDSGQMGWGIGHTKGIVLTKAIVCDVQSVRQTDRQIDRVNFYKFSIAEDRSSDEWSWKGRRAAERINHQTCRSIAGLQVKPAFLTRSLYVYLPCSPG